MPENPFYQNIESNEYFRSLPAFVQETIRQSGPKVSSEEELRRCAEQLMNRK